MAKPLALFGGTFDPIHIGHLVTARTIAEKCRFERITLVPTAAPPHKDSAQASPAHRLAMLKLVCSQDPLFDVCTVELDRTGPSYTYDTLLELSEQHGHDVELNWIIGADMLEGLGSWHRLDELLDIARVVVGSRPPWSERIDELLSGLSGVLSPPRIEQLRESVVETPLIDIASSEIRNRVANRLPIEHLVPDSVKSYMDTHGLYR